MKKNEAASQRSGRELDLTNGLTATGNAYVKEISMELRPPTLGVEERGRLAIPALHCRHLDRHRGPRRRLCIKTARDTWDTVEYIDEDSMTQQFVQRGKASQTSRVTKLNNIPTNTSSPAPTPPKPLTGRSSSPRTPPPSRAI